MFLSQHYNILKETIKGCKLFKSQLHLKWGSARRINDISSDKAAHLRFKLVFYWKEQFLPTCSFMIV